MPEKIFKFVSQAYVIEAIYPVVKINQDVNITLLMIISSCKKPNKPNSEIGYFADKAGLFFFNPGNFILCVN